MEFKRYQFYNVEDFLEDDFFREWSKNPSPKTNAFWEAYISTYPQQEFNVQEARQLTQSIHNHYQSKIDEISKQQAISSYRRLEKKISSSKKSNYKKRLILLLAAASVLLVIGFNSFFIESGALLQSYTTSNGEILSIYLPDSSKVDLNANSNLKIYPEKWENKNQREVWLEGEAYFDVRKKVGDIRFIVHANDVDVKVLGTQFNVRSRGDKSEVILAKGKIELDVANQKIAMIPGDYVSYSNVHRTVESKRVKAADFIAWKNGMTVLNNTLIEITKELETIYGVQFQIRNKELKNRKIQLSVPANNLKEVLETLKLLYPEEINIEQKDNLVTIY